MKDVEKQSVTTSTLSVKSLPLSSDDATSSAESFSSSFVNFLHPNNMMRLQHNGITKQPPTDKSTHHDLITSECQTPFSLKYFFSITFCKELNLLHASVRQVSLRFVVNVFKPSCKSHQKG